MTSAPLFWRASDVPWKMFVPCWPDFDFSILSAIKMSVP